MYEANGKQYIIKLNDYADEHGISVRTVQRKLNAPKYEAELEGEFLRTNQDGTWLTQKAVDFLTSTLQPATQQRVGVVTNEAYERQIADLKQQLYDVQGKYADYVANTTPILLKASEQLALAERSEENQKKAAELEAKNDVLSVEKEQAVQKALEAEKVAQELSDELTEAKAELERLYNRGFFKRLFNK